MLKTVDEIKQELVENELKRVEILNQLNETRKLDPFILLADAIHQKLCRWNHVDGCGYEYEDNTAFFLKSSTKSTYYEKAKRLVTITGFDIETCLKVVKAL